MQSAWIKVDGLEPTEGFKKYIEKEKKGEAIMEDVKRFLDKKYKMKEPISSIGEGGSYESYIK